ncbi:hypothetical protein Aperf_G00000062606 [Anoplocephala perfoliata]
MESDEGKVKVTEPDEEKVKIIPMSLTTMVSISNYQAIFEKVREIVKDCIDDTGQNLLNEIEKMKADDADKYLQPDLISGETIKDVLLKILNVVKVKQEEFDTLMNIYKGVVKFEEKNKAMNIQLNVNESDVNKATTFEELQAMANAEDVVNDSENVNAEAKSLSEIKDVQMYPADIIGENVYAAIDSMRSNEVTMKHLNDLKEALITIKSKDFNKHKMDGVVSASAFQAMKQKFSDVLSFLLKPYQALFQYLQENYDKVAKGDPHLIAYPTREEDRPMVKASRKKEDVIIEVRQFKK